MPVPVFTSGEILTAANMNQVGLWLVKTQTIGSAVSSVTVSDAFSADYDNYRIIVSGGVGSTAQAIGLRLGANATGYYSVTPVFPYAGGAVTNNNVNNGVSWTFAGVSSTVNNNLIVDIMQPFSTKVTTITGTYIVPAAAGNAGGFHGFHDNASSFSAFTLIVGGTMTGGTIRVYGYRN
jgi:hypothetical protein